MLIEIRVVANSSKPGVERFEGGLKVRVRAKPIEGKANAEVIGLVADFLKVPKNRVAIMRGRASKRKVIGVSN
ncbi:DUF167 domain-containing protein [Candidatus Micrarchaeota archaeon]|nr:DUF167 domain-containing protein [Candidatus Micrarchaeota archaeon]MBI5177259.1 DUF167 domain-containing protein [Candidatus Micrarchaeota archaeon]